MTEKPGKIHAAIAKVMADIKPVAKGRKNEQQNYRFRGIADVYAATQRVMAANGLHIVPYQVLDQRDTERTTTRGGTLFNVRIRVQFRIYADDGSFVQLETVGEGMDSGDKAANKAMSGAMKYALIQAFCLPEDQPDEAENDDHEVASNNGSNGHNGSNGNGHKKAMGKDQSALKAMADSMVAAGTIHPKAVADMVRARGASGFTSLSDEAAQELLKELDTYNEPARN